MKKILLILMLSLLSSCVSKKPISESIKESFDASIVSKETTQIIDTDDDCSEIIDHPQLPQGSSILFIGDSLGVGMSKKFIELAKLSGYVPYVHVLTGTTSIQWNKWIESDLKKYRPGLTIISLGTNDASSFGMPPNAEIYKNIFNKVDSSNSFLVWITPPNINPELLPQISEVRKRIIDNIPIYFESEKLDLELTDGIHTTSLGYNKWIEEVWQWMNQKNIVEIDSK